MSSENMIFKKMRSNDLEIGQAYSSIGYYQNSYNNHNNFNNSNNNSNSNSNSNNNSNNNNNNRGYYQNSNFTFNNKNNYRGRGRNNYNDNRGRNRGQGRGRGRENNNSYFKPTMLIDPWQDLVEEMISSNKLPESERYKMYGVPIPLCQETTIENEKEKEDIIYDEIADNEIDNEIVSLLAAKKNKITEKDANEIEI